MTYKIPRASVLYIYMSYCPSVHVLTSMASVTNASYNVLIKLLDINNVSMVTDAILLYMIIIFNNIM